jgi:hypothetical protein
VPAAATGDSCENDRERGDGDELSHISTYTPPLSVPSHLRPLLHEIHDGVETGTAGSRRDPPAAERREIEEARIERPARDGAAQWPDVCTKSPACSVNPPAGYARSASCSEPTELGADPTVLLDDRRRAAASALRNRDESPMRR